MLLVYLLEGALLAFSSYVGLLDCLYFDFSMFTAWLCFYRIIYVLIYDCFCSAVAFCYGEGFCSCSCCRFTKIKFIDFMFWDVSWPCSVLDSHLGIFYYLA